MRSRTYKIKNTKTGLFWSGYGSNFTEKGAEFTSYETAAYELRRQIGLKHTSINGWLSDAEVVEYEVTVTQMGSGPALRAILRSAYYEMWNKKYGRFFVKHYHKLNSDPETKDVYAYAMHIPAEFPTFRESMKNLGFSSRHYKKTENWIWIKDTDVVMRAKLLDQHDYLVDIKALEADFEEKVADTVMLYSV